MAVNKRTICFLLVVTLTGIACKKSKEEPVDFKYDYAPQTVGHYCIYDVTEIRHDHPSNVHDTLIYQLKEKIESTFTDAEGRPSLRIERSKKNSAGNWYVSDIWYATVTTTRYEKVEEDERFIRLVFPVKENTKWNGNAYNQQDEWEYKYQEADIARTVNGIAFDQTVVVLQKDELNFVQRQFASEVYAKHVGLVSKYYKNLTITGSDTTLALKGNELYMKIITHGTE